MANKKKLTNGVNDEKKKAKQLYLEHKQALLEKEKDNYTKLYLIATPDGWYKLFSHSALFLSHYLKARMGKAYRLYRDADFGVQNDIGTVSIRGDKLDEFMKRAEYAHLTLVKKWDGGLEFDIGERLTEEDVAAMIHEDELVIERANSMVLPHAMMPELLARMRELVKTVHEVVRVQSKMSQTAFLSDMERKATRMNMQAIAMARGAIKIDAALELLLDGTEALYEYILTMFDMDMIQPKKYYNVVKKIRSLEEQVKREAAKRALENVKRKDNKNKIAKEPDASKLEKPIIKSREDLEAERASRESAGLPAAEEKEKQEPELSEETATV